MNKKEVERQLARLEFQLSMLEQDPENNKKEITDLEHKKPILHRLWEYSD